jgi:hypothetical protein
MSTSAARTSDDAPKGLRPPKPCKGLRQLVNHRDVAAAFGVTTESLIRWMRKGEFPSPHSTLGTFYLFPREMIEYRLRTGKWPAGTKFRGMPMYGVPADEADD